jgi:hypothetical protein
MAQVKKLVFGLMLLHRYNQLKILQIEKLTNSNNTYDKAAIQSHKDDSQS